MKSAIDSGLADVVVADTKLSLVDGSGGRLVLSGHPLEQLAGVRRFAAVCGLLWEGSLPEDPDRVAKALGEGRAWAFGQLPRMRPALDATDAMAALRGALAVLADEPGTSVEIGGKLAGAVAVVTAAHARLSRGLEPLAPDPNDDHAADLLRTIRGERAPRAHSDALDRYLVTVADHGMNASTFTARVVTSTGTDAVSAIVAAVGALKGPLHGGAPGPVLDMLDAIARAEKLAQENAEDWVRGELAAGRRIMGMGHRIYRVRDPRAAVLEEAIAMIEQAGTSSCARLALARAVEQAAERVLAERHPDRALRANVEFYTAVLLEALGLERTHFSTIFAAGRVAGWWAHVLEQRATGRLIRPKARYVGPAS